MPGKYCDGVATHTTKDLRNSKAFCEGLSYRASGSSFVFPITDNPHPANSEASAAWAAGWNVTNDASATTIDPADAPCCAVPTGTIVG